MRRKKLSKDYYSKFRYVTGIDVSFNGFAGYSFDLNSNTEAIFRIKRNKKVSLFLQKIELIEKFCEYYKDAGFSIPETLFLVEDYIFKLISHNFSALLGEIKGILYAYLKINGCDDNAIFVVNPSMVKKYIANNGRANKEEVAQEILRQYDKNFSDHNIADAFVLALIGYDYLKNNLISSYKLDIIKKIF